MRCWLLSSVSQGLGEAVYILTKLISGVSFTVVPNNFPIAHQRPEVGLTVAIMYQRSDTMNQGGGLALLSSDRKFCGWIHEAYRFQVEALGEGPWDGTVTEIYRHFEWEQGGGHCCEGYIQISGGLAIELIASLTFDNLFAQRGQLVKPLPNKLHRKLLPCLMPMAY